MPITRMAWLFAALMGSAARADADATPAPKHAYLYSISPQDGARVKGAFLRRFGLRNKRVVPAGNDSTGSGHHHLLVGADEPMALKTRHIHFGERETEAMIDVPRGRHALELVLGDARDSPFKPLGRIWVPEDE